MCTTYLWQALDDFSSFHLCLSITRSNKDCGLKKSDPSVIPEMTFLLDNLCQWGMVQVQLVRWRQMYQMRLAQILGQRKTTHALLSEAMPAYVGLRHTSAQYLRVWHPPSPFMCT